MVVQQYRYIWFYSVLNNFFIFNLLLGLPYLPLVVYKFWCFVLRQQHIQVTIHFIHKNFFIVKKRQHRYIFNSHKTLSLKFKMLTSFYWQQQNKNINKITKSYVLNYLNFFYFPFLFTLLPTFHPLVGLKLPITCSELKQKKKWLLSQRNFFARRVRRWYKFDFKNKKSKYLVSLFEKNFQNSVRMINIYKKKKIHKKVHLTSFEPSQLWLKQFYFNHLFHFFQFRLGYKKLKFKLRRFRVPFPKHVTIFKYKNPYSFLNVPFYEMKDIYPPLASTFSAYKLYRKIFRAFRRLCYRKRRKTYFYFQKLSHSFSFFRLLRPRFRGLKKFSSLSFSLLPCINISNSLCLSKHSFTYNSQLIKSLSFFVVPQRCRKSTLIMRRLQQFLQYKTLTYYNLQRFSWYKIKLTLKITRTLRILCRYYRQQNRFKQLLIGMQVNHRLNTFFRKSQSWNDIQVSQMMIYKITYKLNNCSKFSFFSRWEIQPKTAVFYEANTFKRLLFVPFSGLFFFMPISGFLALTHVLPIALLSLVQPYVNYIRKIKYSFSFRDDLPKHVLSKYNYTRVALNDSRYFQIQQLLTIKVNATFSSLKFFSYLNDLILPFLQTNSLINTVAYQQFNNTSFLLTNFYWKNHDWVYKPLYTIFVIKFKPGYMRYWRRARRALQIRTKTYFRYQHQLTHYLISYKNIAHLQFVALLEMQLINVILRSRLVLDQSTAKLFIHQHIIFINGICCLNSKFQVCFSDFIQLLISFKYYITFRWLLSHSLKVKTRIKHTSKRLKYKKKLENPDKKYSKRQPLWVSSYLYLFLDIAKYMEVDFFTLSIFLLYDPFLWGDTNIYHETILKPQIFNMYNWKYIT